MRLAFSEKRLPQNHLLAPADCYNLSAFFVTSSPMRRDSVAKAWERFGRQDPYYGVLNSPRFRAAGHAGPARADFFASGDLHVEHLFKVVRESLVPDFAPRSALDFGCGVGRILLPLARVVRQVVGVDISPSMLGEARRNCQDACLSNVALHSSVSELAGTFDLIHSYIVFQHIPPSSGMKALETLLSVLAEGGVGAIHVVYAARMPRWRTGVHWLRKRVPGAHLLMNMLQRRPASSPLMEMNRYDLNAVLALLQEKGCHRVSIRFSDHGGWLGAFILFQRRVSIDRQVL